MAITKINPNTKTCDKGEDDCTINNTISLDIARVLCFTQ